MSDDKARNPDPITVTLTREEAEALGGKAYPLAACRSGQAKLREAVYSEARPITDEMVEAGAKAMYERDYLWDQRRWPDQADYWEAKEYRADARACLEAALGEDE